MILDGIKMSFYPKSVKEMMQIVIFGKKKKFQDYQNRLQKKSVKKLKKNTKILHPFLMEKLLIMLI